MRKKIIENIGVDQKLTDHWSNNKHISSHLEAYTCAIHEQEISTKNLIYRIELKNNQQPTNGNKCCLCKVHIISNCSKMSSRYYLPIRHNVIAKRLYEALRRKKDPKCKIEYKENEFINQDNGTKYWLNVAIKTAVKVRHNRPDLVIWNIENNIVISCRSVAQRM